MKALALVESPDHVCCRYRIKAFESALERAGISLQITGLARGPLARAIQLARLPRFETVILQRRLLPAWQFLALRRRARHLVFDFDDAVLYRDSYDERGPHCPRRARRFATTVRTCDAVIAGNDFLADCALRAGAKPQRVRVIPTCVDTVRYSPSDGHHSRSGIDLVWIGSSSTLKGLETQRPLWDQVAREVPRVRLRLIADRGADLGAMPVTAIPWKLATEAGELAAGDVGISWVPDDLWSRGKCGLKVLQYQASGLPVLANAVGVHSEMIEPGVTGWLPASAYEWVDAIRTLAIDDLLRTEMGRAGRASVENGYSVKAWEGTFVTTIAGESSVPPPNFRSSGGETARRKDGRLAPALPHQRSRGPSTNGTACVKDSSDGAAGARG